MNAPLVQIQRLRMLALADFWHAAKCYILMYSIVVLIWSDCDISSQIYN